MKIKRFLAPNMREALKAVRTEQGPDAVILSNRRIGDYIEIIAALDYDEALVNQALRRPDASATDDAETVQVEISDEALGSADVQDLMSRADTEDSLAETSRLNDTHITALDIAANGDTGGASLRDEIAAMRQLLQEQVCNARWQRRASADPASAQILRNLTRLGLGADIANRLCRQISGDDKRLKHAWRQPIAALTQSLPTLDERLLLQGGIAAFVGPTGVGKTTTIAKIASQFAVRHGARSIALISMDNYRIGAHEQLRTFGRIINADVFEASDAMSLRKLLAQLEEYRLVLIDTAGISQRDVRLAEMLDSLNHQQRPIDLYLTLAATADAHVLSDIAKSYSSVTLAGVALTKIDEAARLGGALTVLIRDALPL
ncbi:MAG: flagellar biosynthesis protein FlhF, partial [Pseudomonadota bacterium]